MALPNVDDVEPLVMPSNGEHDLEILNGNEFVSQKGRTCLRLNIRVMDEEDADDVQAMVFYPSDNDDPKDYRRYASELKKFLEAFSLSGGEETEDMQGAVGRGIIKQQKNRQTGEDEARVTSWV